jgi:hypothetical protein
MLVWAELAVVLVLVLVVAASLVASSGSVSAAS